MSMTLNERNPNCDELYIDTQAATITLPGKVFRKHSRIKNVSFINQLGIAADNTNFLQLSLQSLDGSIIYATLDTRAAGQGAVVANVPKALALVGPVGDVANQPEVDVLAGSNMVVVVTKNGTGVPTLAKLNIEWYPL